MCVPGVRKTYQEKLRPTPAQERELAETLWRCRALYNTALEQRITAWERCHVSVTRSQQEAEVQAIRAEFPAYAAIHRHVLQDVLQDVLARLDKAYQAFFRRVQAGQAPGFPRFQGRTRYHSFTYKEYGNGARLANGSLVLSKLGRIAVRWSRQLGGIPKTVTIRHEADGWYVSFSRADVPTRPLPETGCETGIDVGLQVFLMTAQDDGAGRDRRQPAPLSARRNDSLPRPNVGYPGARRAVRVARRRWHCWRSSISTSSASAETFGTRRRSCSFASTTRSITRPFNPPT